MHSQPLEVLEAWRNSTSEYKDALSWDTHVDWPKRTQTLKEAERPCDQWQKPRYGTIKINTDETQCKTTIRAGVGWLGRDFAGLLQAAGGSGTGYCHSAAAAKACAIRDTLRASIDHGFD